MRDIKFRAWLPDHKLMIYSFENEDDFFWDIGIDGITIKAHTVIDEMWDGEHYQSNGIEEAESKIMQYTGLKDKMGKDIFEGDIVNTGVKYAGGDLYPNGVIATIEYFPGGFYVYSNDKFCLSLSGNIKSHSIDSQVLHVIGNIYENEELLNETKI